MKVYICGPVTGYSDLNLPVFEAAAEQLREAGMEPVLPHDFVPDDASHAEAMDICLERFYAGDIAAVAVLPGFSDSSGSRKEIETATSISIPVYPIDAMLEACENVGQRADIEAAGKALCEGFIEGYEQGLREAEALLASMNNGYMYGKGLA